MAATGGREAPPCLRSGCACGRPPAGGEGPTCAPGDATAATRCSDRVLARTLAAVGPATRGPERTKGPATLASGSMEFSGAALPTGAAPSERRAELPPPDGPSPDPRSFVKAVGAAAARAARVTRSTRGRGGATEWAARAAAPAPAFEPTLRTRGMLVPLTAPSGGSLRVLSKARCPRGRLAL